MKKGILSFLVLFYSPLLIAQQEPITTESWYFSPGIIGTIFLIVIVLVLAIFILIGRIGGFVNHLSKRNKKLEKRQILNEINNLDEAEIDNILSERKSAIRNVLTGTELGSEIGISDNRALVKKIYDEPENLFFEEKKKTDLSFETPAELKKLMLYYLGAGIFWLIFGTLVGQYLGLKFIWPDLDSVSWLSFGRLRPVHTNTVFWGWTSLTMIGLGYFVIFRTSNTKIHSIKLGYIAFILINLCVFIGNILLMSGINNGGGEYREYVWPVMLLFAIGIVITFINFYKTVANRKISEIYISNWFILASLIWTIILSIIGYLPFYQEGLGETITQGYYMHQGVGMWFMSFTLGLVYYYLPAALNKPIYSYSLGVLGFWTQMLFYTLIGTHHFIFSPLPWWLQTVAIVFSAGMFIPVLSGTTNFLLTMKGSFSQISKSYVLPFFLVGVVFYFVGSTQGSFQAFRFTNFIWHFTDFNVAHSHITMYGIIAFFLWASFYAIVPKITGTEPPQILVGAHFWFAFIGLFAYMFSLMAGGTLKGLSWIENEPFIQSVILMRPYWVWRAIGGSLMFLSHLVFAYNFYVMVRSSSSEMKLQQIN